MKSSHIDQNRFKTIKTPFFNKKSGVWEQRTEYELDLVKTMKYYPYCFVGPHDFDAMAASCYEILYKIDDKSIFGKDENCISYLPSYQLSFLGNDDGLRSKMEILSFDDVMKICKEGHDSINKEDYIEKIARRSILRFSTEVYNGDYEHAMSYVAPQYRLVVFRDMMKFISGIERGKMLKNAWQFNLGFRDNFDVIQEIFDDMPRDELDASMSDEEISVLKELRKSKTVKLYRGVMGEKSSHSCDGYSWTTSLEQAEFFAFDYHHWGLEKQQYGYVVEAEVNPERIHLFINDRDEHECVVSPDYVFNTKIISKRKRAA